MNESFKGENQIKTGPNSEAYRQGHDEIDWGSMPLRGKGPRYTIVYRKDGKEVAEERLKEIERELSSLE